MRRVSRQVCARTTSSLTASPSIVRVFAVRGLNSDTLRVSIVEHREVRPFEKVAIIPSCITVKKAVTALRNFLREPRDSNCELDKKNDYFTIVGGCAIN